MKSKSSPQIELKPILDNRLVRKRNLNFSPSFSLLTSGQGSNECQNGQNVDSKKFRRQSLNEKSTNCIVKPEFGPLYHRNRIVHVVGNSS